MTAAVVSLGLVASLSVANAATSQAAPSAKRGIASPMYLKTAPSKLTSAGAHWSYNWTYRVPASTTSLSVVPMIRTKSSLTTDAVNALIKARKAGDYKYLLGFNEPDNKTQANLTPTQAADLWPKLEATGLTLGTPAVASATNGWLKSFMALVAKRHLKVDFIALHFYARITDTNAINRITQTIATIRKHYGKPIWITELGLTDTRANPGSSDINWAKAKKFMTTIFAKLDAMSYVQRYAWMGDNVTNRPALKWSSIYDKNGKLTSLGETYKGLQGK